jgi:hypothetical protein
VLPRSRPAGGRGRAANVRSGWLETQGFHARATQAGASETGSPGSPRSVRIRLPGSGDPLPAMG